MSHARLAKLPADTRTPRTAQPGRYGAPQSAASSGVPRSSSCACGGGCPRCAPPLIRRQPLSISAPADAHEREADRVADHITRTAQPVQAREPPATQAPDSTALDTAADTATAVDAASRGGTALSYSLRAHFEPRIGVGLDRVRVHADAEAASAARGVQARAYTLGNDIVFGAGEFAPSTSTGQRLLAHELVHVAQQAGSGNAPPTVLSRQPAPPAAAAAASSPTKSEDVRVRFTWKDLLAYPLLVDVWNDVVLKRISPADLEPIGLKGTEGAAFYAWAMAVGLAPGATAGGDKPKDFGEGVKAVGKYADALTGLTPAADSILDPLSRIVGLRLDDYLSSDLFMSRLKTHASSLTSLIVLAQGVFSIVIAAKKANEDPTTLEGDATTQHLGLIKALVGAALKKQLKAPNFFDVGPMQLATHPAFSAAPFAGGGAPSGFTFERNKDIHGDVREQKYGLTLNLPQFIKPGGATAADIADPGKYRGWQGSLWFTYDSSDPLTVTPDKQPAQKFKGGTIFGAGGHFGELEAGAQYGGATGKELTSWFARGGYGYAAGEKDTGLKKIGFTATFMDWKENYVLAPRSDLGVPAAGWGLKTTPFVSTQFKVGDKTTIDASAAVSFVTGSVGDAKTSVGISDVAVGLSYTYGGATAPGKLPVFKLDLTGSMSRLDWWDPNSPLLWGLQAKGNIGRSFAGAQVMTGAGVQTTPGGAGIPEPRLDALGPTVKTMVPTTVLFTGGYAF